MKKVIAMLCFFTGLAGVKAQNSLEVTVGSDVCFNSLTLTFTDHSSKSVDLGCVGVYSFDLTDSVLSDVIVNGVTCLPGNITDVTSSNSINIKADFSASGKTLKLPSPRDLDDPGQTME